MESVENAASFDEFKKYLHVLRPVEEELRALLTRVNATTKKTLVLLCGSAGDGKSHLLSYLRNADAERLLDGFEVYNDATESSAPLLTSIDTLAEKLAPFNDENCHIDDGFKMIFWDCASLRRVDALGAGTVIEKNAFGNCPSLTEGFIAPGFPADDSAPAQLLYTLLWCTCPERHTQQTAERASAFVRAKEALIMEKIIKMKNTAALAGVVSQKLLDPSHIDEYIRICAQEGSTELTALLLQAKGSAVRAEEEFDL